MLIIDCRNQIGDTIYLIKPLRRFLASQRIEEVALAAGDGLPAEIVRRSFPGNRVDSMDALRAAWPEARLISAGAVAAWAEAKRDNGHISQGFARLLGFEWTDSIAPDVSWMPNPSDEQPEYIVLAPFSVSCDRHLGKPPNKTLDEDAWLPLLQRLRGYGRPLRVAGTPQDRLLSRELGFSETDYFSAVGIEDLVSFLRRGWLVVGVDNGVCHVSSCAGIPTVVLWPAAVEQQFIGETWARRTRLLPMGSPAEFDAYRMDRLVAGAVEDLLSWKPNASEPAAQPAASNSSELPFDGHEAGGRALFPAFESATFIPLRHWAGGVSNWSGHLPFARDLVASLRPRLLVELGTHYGESYFGLCQSVVETGCACSCYAVDTWAGDPHSLAYGEEVYADVRRHNAERYASFSRLLRKTFDEALAWFPDSSIDLLHIDGLHTYEAVQRDFAAWYPKVAPGGIVLLHDVAARHADFGVWRLWEEISPTHEAFDFHHCHGLGVIRKPGHSPHRAGILEYLFVRENADAIRRYYVLAAERLDQGAGMAAAAHPGTGLVCLDPPGNVVTALKSGWIDLPLGSPYLAANDLVPCSDVPDTWRAETPDPWMSFPTDISCRSFRFFVLSMSCSSAAPEPCAQLFWSGPRRPGFNERLSVRFPLVPDGRIHTYVLDLHAGSGFGALNHLWWHGGNVNYLRLDPLDAAGEFTIVLSGFAHQDAAECPAVRDWLRLPPLRAELSYRYLTGSGLAIGPAGHSLELRPDAHVRFAETLAKLEIAEPGSGELGAPAAGACETPDFLIANHALQQASDPLNLIRTWLQAVRPGGCVFIVEPAAANPLDSLLEPGTNQIPGALLESRVAASGSTSEQIVILRKR